MGKIGQFSKNLSALTLVKIVNALVPIIILPYLIRVIGLEKHGVLVYALAITAYFQPIIDYSFNITGVRKIANLKDQDNLQSFISMVFSIKLGITLASILVGFLLIYTLPLLYKERLVLILTLLGLIPYALSSYWVFIGFEKVKYFAYASIIPKLILLLLTFYLINEPDDYWVYPLLSTSSSFLTALIGLQLILQKQGFLIKIRFTRQLFILLKANFKLFLNQFLPHLYTSTSILILQSVEGMYAVGIFGAIQKVISFSEVGLKMLSTISFPHLIRNPKKFLRYQSVQIGFTLITILAVIVSHDLIFNILNIDAHMGFYILTILSMGTLGYMLYDIYGQNYFVRIHKDGFVMYRTLINCSIGFILSFIFVYQYGLIGAAITIAITRLLIGGTMFVSYIIKHQER